MTIFVKILGGMGNQMFQYAVAKSLATKLNCELLLDIESLKRHGERAYDLSHFKIDEKIATFNDFKKLGLGFLSYPLVKLKRHPNYYLEKQFTFNSELFNFKAPLYLDGYFQSEKYYSNSVDLIRDSFNFVKDYSNYELEVLGKMEEGTAISLHVRRGDYVTNAQAKLLMGETNIAYYQAAINKMKTEVENPIFLIFSDDVEWVKKNIKIEALHYFVTENTGAESFRDMRLMSKCQHHIIANSSFSWWGAWLNASAVKKVIAPKKWFQDDRPNDLVISSWETI